MKPTKVAAVVAGSVMALGAAAPAMAAESAAVPTSLDGGLGSLTSKGLKTDALSSTTDGSVVKTVGDAANTLNKTEQARSLLGGLPLGN
ncbi:hypothetical protein [Streptomyces sp. NPDC006551]|uniref:hypothetical protein n=1 Tax=Streptomyces sp. NPDC006551 TaxID=3157178 RepID=UPI0033A381F6